MDTVFRFWWSGAEPPSHNLSSARVSVLQGVKTALCALLPDSIGRAGWYATVW
jgi:hypothetical protein